MKYGKGIAALLCTALLAGTLAGCGKKEADAGMEPVKGRYKGRGPADGAGGLDGEADVYRRRKGSPPCRGE